MKKEQRSQKTTQGRHGLFKRGLLLTMLITAAFVLSSCYVEPDRYVDDNNAIGTDGQTFDTLLTPTPEVTATPTPDVNATATSNVSTDWNVNWNFGTDNTDNTSSGQNVISVGDTATPGANSTSGGLTITTATPNAATSTSEIMKSGSEGENVQQLQQRLKELGYYTGTVDGKYGAGTVSAVKAFQSGNNLNADGVAGPSTQSAINSSSAIAKKDVKVTATPKKTSSGSGAAATPKATAYKVPSSARTDIYLQLGSSGAQVKILQNRLISLGYLTGTADSNFGATTEAAVIAFQKRNSIYSDGIAGPTTLAKLYSSSAKSANSVVATLGTLREGMNGSGVRALQTQLKTLGYYTGSVDGDYGAGTKAAVMAFQSANNLTADGVAGTATLNAIYGGTSTGGGSGSGSGSTSSNPTTYGSAASSTGYTTITSGSSKSNVTQLQSVLQSKNYYSGSLDGSYGGGTKSAVEAFQAAVGLRVTGMAGPSTQRLLYGTTNASGSYNKLEQGGSNSTSAVKSLQYALYELKYYDGNISGTYDEATKNAVMLFQQVNGLGMDGIAGQDTQRRLFSSYAIPMNL